MTVTEGYNFETHDLVSHSRFFPVRIQVPHHQLRNFISTVYEGKVYFVHDYDIYVLDLVNNQRSLVATVPFVARCLAAAYGWVCVGGETNGDCAFVRIAENETDAGQFGLDLVVDMLGKDIVNSMTIHKIPARHHTQADEVVVLISNNDRTVTLYSLSQQEVLSVLDHPVAMNYASMSPDCTVIAAVGDSDEVFFYQRRDPDDDHDKYSESNEYAEYKWIPLRTPKVPSGEGVWDDYSFAAAFSPNGRLCAVSAQGGFITVLNMDALMAGDHQSEKSIVCTFRSSRSSLWGCVRSMSFSPPPWDLLAWTEDHGRIGVADVRQSFSRRQCMSLDQDASTSIQVGDVTPAEIGSLDVKERLKQQHLQRMRALRGHLPVGARPFENRQDSDMPQEAAPLDLTMDLDRQEQSVLEALETTTDGETHSLRPYSVNYLSDPVMRPSTTSTGREYNIQLLNPGARTGTVLPMPRRTNSVVLSAPSTNRRPSLSEAPITMMTTESPAPMSEDNTTPPMSTNDLTPSHERSSSSQPMPYNIPPSDPWHVIEAALGTNRNNRSTRPNESRGSASSLTYLENSIMAERGLANSLERQLADERRLSTMLRTELEAREQLLEARQQHAQSPQIPESRLSPSLERVLQRQLQLEVENGRQRSDELESEMRINSQRLERLSNARNALEERSRQMSGTLSGEVARVSATTSANSSSAELRELEGTLLQLDDERRARQQRIQDLEVQVRRAESRVELASVQNSVARAEQRDGYHERLLDARFLHAARGSVSSFPGSGQVWQVRSDTTDDASGISSTTPTPSQPQTAAARIRGAAIRRATATIQANLASRAQQSELAGRVSESDMQLARIMLQRASVDANGNWVAGHGFRRLFGSGTRPVSTLNAHSRRAPTNIENRSMEEMMREGGLGTAGVGWSPDGRHLYVGSEAGIFEFKVHIKDRMCFPSVEFR